VLLTGQGCGQNDAGATAAAVLEQGRAAWLASDFDQAQTLYQTYLTRFPQGSDRLEAWKRLGDIALNVKGNPAAAARILESALLEFEARPSLRDDLAADAAKAWLQAGEPARALVHLQGLLEKTSLSIENRVTFSLQYSRALMALHRFSDALHVLEQCRQADVSRAATAPCALSQAALLRELQQADAARLLWNDLFSDTAVPAAVRAQAGFALGEDAEARHDRKAAKEYYEALRNIYPNPAVIDKKLDYLRQ